MFGVHFPAKSDSQPLPLLPSFAAFLKLLEDCSTGLQHVKCGNARLQGQNSKIRLHRGAANTFSLPKQVRLATPVKWSQICLSGAAAAFWVRKR